MAIEDLPVREVARAPINRGSLKHLGGVQGNVVERVYDFLLNCGMLGL
jgi:hypothetical protein